MIQDIEHLDFAVAGFPHLFKWSYDSRFGVRLNHNATLNLKTTVATVATHPDMIINDDTFCNHNGYLRLTLVQKHFGLFTKKIGSYLDDDEVSHTVDATIQTKSLTPADLAIIVDTYTSYRDFDESIPYEFVYRDYDVLDTDSGVLTYLKNGIETSERVSRRVEDFYSHNFNVRCNVHNGVVFVPIEVSKWSAHPCCKRGNDAYIELVKKKFDQFTTKEPLVFFDTNLDTNRKRTRRTNMLYITGTTDPSICGFDMGWLEFGSHWNSFITNIKQQFGGKIVYIRTWQSHKNGFPHFHSLIYFKDIEFTAVPNWDYNEKTGKHDKLSWRIPSRAKLHKGDDLTIRQRFKNAWKYGTIDILCVSDTHKSFKDLLKYVIRDLEGGESDLTNSMIWYFGRQAFSYSKDFAKVVWGTSGDIDLSEDKFDVDLICTNSSNSNLELLRIVFYPQISDAFLYDNPPKTHQRTLFDFKDPPSKRGINADIVKNSIDGYVMVECKNSKLSEKFGCPVYRYVPGD